MSFAFLRDPLRPIKNVLARRLDHNSRVYNAIVWTYGVTTGQRRLRQHAWRGLRKDSRFEADELEMAAGCPTGVLDAVVHLFAPTTVLDVGCGLGSTMAYLISKGIDCVGLEGSRAAIDRSTVADRIQCADLRSPVRLGRMFDLVWSFEVAEHLHESDADQFVATLAAHSSRIVMSAAKPGQGGEFHFNEQPQSYWQAKLAGLHFEFLEAESRILQQMPDRYAENVMVFVRRA